MTDTPETPPDKELFNRFMERVRAPLAPRDSDYQTFIHRAVNDSLPSGHMHRQARRQQQKGDFFTHTLSERLYRLPILIPEDIYSAHQKNIHETMQSTSDPASKRDLKRRLNGIEHGGANYFLFRDALAAFARLERAGEPRSVSLGIRRSTEIMNQINSLVQDTLNNEPLDPHYSTLRDCMYRPNAPHELNLLADSSMAALVAQRFIHIAKEEQALFRNGAGRG